MKEKAKMHWQEKEKELCAPILNAREFTTHWEEGDSMKEKERKKAKVVGDRPWLSAIASERERERDRE